MTIRIVLIVIIFFLPIMHVTAQDGKVSFKTLQELCNRDLNACEVELNIRIDQKFNCQDKKKQLIDCLTITRKEVDRQNLMVQQIKVIMETEFTRKVREIEKSLKNSQIENLEKLVANKAIFQKQEIYLLVGLIGLIGLEGFILVLIFVYIYIKMKSIWHRKENNLTIEKSEVAEVEEKSEKILDGEIIKLENLINKLDEIVNESRARIAKLEQSNFEMTETIAELRKGVIQPEKKEENKSPMVSGSYAGQQERTIDEGALMDALINTMRNFPIENRNDNESMMLEKVNSLIKDELWGKFYTANAVRLNFLDNSGFVNDNANWLVAFTFTFGKAMSKQKTWVFPHPSGQKTTFLSKLFENYTTGAKDCVAELPAICTINDGQPIECLTKGRLQE